MLETIKRRLMRLLPDGVAGRLRSWRVRRLIRTYRPHVVEHTYGAERLKVYLADPMAQGWYDSDWPELPELARLRQSRLRPGARVFAVGAHQGVVAAMIARADNSTTARDRGDGSPSKPSPSTNSPNASDCRTSSSWTSKAPSASP